MMSKKKLDSSMNRLYHFISLLTLCSSSLLAAPRRGPVTLQPRDGATVSAPAPRPIERDQQQVAADAQAKRDNAQSLHPQAYPESEWDKKFGSNPSWPARRATWHAWGKQLWSALTLHAQTQAGVSGSQAKLSASQERWRKDERYKKLHQGFARARGMVERSVKRGMTYQDAMKTAIEKVIAGMSRSNQS
jgi:hypothetical protein